MVDKLGEDVVVIDDFNKLWEVPAEPFLQSHTESINVFIQLLNKSNCLHNWFILPVNVSGALLSGVTMSKTKLCTSDVFVLDLFHDFDEVGPDASLELCDRLVVRSCESGFSENFLAHFWIHYAQKELLLLGALGGWEMCNKEVLERAGHFVRRNCSDIL